MASKKTDSGKKIIVKPGEEIPGGPPRTIRCNSIAYCCGKKR